VSENLCSPDEERIRALEETIAYMQRDHAKLQKQLEAVMTDVASNKKRIESWPFVKVSVK
jgi:phage shock protein A